MESEPAVVPGKGVVLLTRPGCHLCEEARITVDRVARGLGVRWRELSATDAPALGERFAEELPVLFIDGVQRDFWSIDEVRLHRLLSRMSAHDAA